MPKDGRIPRLTEWLQSYRQVYGDDLYLHASRKRLERFYDPQDTIHFSRLGDFDGKTQAEYYGISSIGTWYHLCRLGPGKKFNYDLGNEEARRIMDEALPPDTWDRETKIRYLRLDYQDEWQVVPLARQHGYNRFLIYEHSVQNYSHGVTDPNIITILDRLYVAPEEFSMTEEMRHYVDLITEQLQQGPDDKTEEALWWAQRWISGSHRDPDWDDSWTTMSMDDAMFHLGSLVQQSLYERYPLLWRAILIPRNQLAKFKRSMMLLPDGEKAFQGFTVSRESAEDIASDLHIVSKDSVSVIVEAKIPPGRILFGVRDLENIPGGKTMLPYIAEWIDQDEVFVDMRQPLRVETISIADSS